MEKVYAKQGQSIQVAYKKNLKGVIVRELGNLCSFAPTHLAFWAWGVSLK